MLEYAAMLRDAGIEVTSRWIKGGHQISDDQLNDGLDKRLLGARYATEDFTDLDRATIAIFFSEEPRSTPSRGGRHVELGAALMLGKRCVLVGPIENAFMCLEQIEQYGSWHDAFLALIAELPARQVGEGEMKQASSERSQ